MTKDDEKIIAEYISISKDVLLGGYPILSTGSGMDVLKEMTYRLRNLSPRQRKKIQNIFLR